MLSGALRLITTQVILIAAATILFIDVISYFLLPARIVRVFPPYRFDQSAEIKDIISRRANPERQAYYVAHPERGFNIGTERHSFNVTETERYEISSNELGCFDKPWKQTSEDYMYLAGDSMTWGSAPLEKTFGFLFEAATGTLTAKCGVPHTGQLHQFSKFIEVTSKIGRLPKRVVVGYYVNDFANDNAHPHSTVVDGLLIDTAVLDENDRPIRLSQQQIKERARRTRQVREERDNRIFGENVLFRLLRRYSITANVANAILHEIKLRHPVDATASAALQASGRNLYDRTELICVPRVFPFVETGIYENHAKILRRWAEHAASNGYSLTFLLIPTAYCHDNIEFYAKLREFLGGLGIDFIDLSFDFKARRLKEEELYWMQDRHLTFLGHQVVAEVLAARLRP
jgi:hypothetical protein